jgi:hypothetical protein
VVIVLIERVRSKHGKGMQVSAVKDYVGSLEKWVIRSPCGLRIEKMEKKI